MKKRSILLILLAVMIALPLMPASAATYYYVNGTSFLKVRELPDSTARVKDSYRQDFAVITYKKYDANWAFVHFSDGSSGYVMRKYLKSSSTSTAYVTKDNSAMRAGPATSFKQTATLYQGDKVRVLTSGSSWSYVSCSAGTGYIRKSLLSSKAVKRSGNAGTPYAAYVVNSAGRTVNVRSGAGTNYKVLGELDPGTAITVERVSGSWSKITGPISGWMMNTYISKNQPAPTPTLEPGTTPTPKPASGKTRYITSANGKSVNMRHGPSEKGYAVKIQIPYGSKVTVLSSENGWSKVQYGTITGYVKNDFLTSREPGTTPTPKPGETPKPTKEPFVTFTGTVVNPSGRTVNLRKGPSTSYATITSIAPGEKVEVFDESGSWYKVTHGSDTGYMMKSFIEK